MKHKRQNGRVYWIRRLSFIFFVANPLRAETIAVLGDSISTGAVSDPAMNFDHVTLWERFEKGAAKAPDQATIKALTGLESAAVDVRRLWPSVLSYSGYFPWYGSHLQLMFSSLYLDTLSYSWPALMAKTSDRVLIAAQDGARMEAAAEQGARLLEETKQRLPEKIFIFFTGNDLCSSSISFITSAVNFKSELLRALQVLFRGQVGMEGSDVYIVSHLSILQLRTSQQILTKAITAYGHPQTCASLNDPKTDLKINAPEDQLGRVFMNFMPRRSADICPTVFGANLDATEGQSAVLANRILAFREAMKAVVDEAKPPSGIRLHYVSETADLMFHPDDIANDCFHLSIQGQSRIAKLVRQAIEKR